MSLYFLINIVCISVPFLVSFHPEIKLNHHFKALFAAIFVSLIPFVIWDVYFTENGIWGFNETYLEGFKIAGLPWEEWLFFICIPYACVFTHIAIMRLFPRVQIPALWINKITITLLLTFSILLLLNLSRWYTLVVMSFAIVILTSTFLFSKNILSRFYFTFPFMLVPFFIVNGILTGTGIEGEVVWYNDLENLGIRIVTIPIEDSVYAFSLILLNLGLFNLLTKEELVSQPRLVEK